jgi:hypothetical protein
VRALVVFNGFARMLRDDNYPIGIPQRFVEQFRDAVTDTNPDPSARRVDDLALQAPSLASDARFRAWWQRAGEQSASPGVSRSQFQLILQPRCAQSSQRSESRRWSCAPGEPLHPSRPGPLPGRQHHRCPDELGIRHP